jgi:hypothetical protein
LSTRLSYDISIWEEIRSIVRWKTDAFVGNISKEIPKDLSLSEFHGRQPVPWQLREIMEQRANTWVKSLYDICCYAHQNIGKEHSADFDRSVWAYCVEPFIMGKKELAIHDYTMSECLELLLCAVGSPPEKRNLLKVSQKDCCLAVRLKVCETWRDKLHHLPPRIDEAVAALSRFKAMEVRAARIVAGLPPEPPPPPPRPAPPLAESLASGPPQTTPVPLSATVPASPPLGPVQNGFETEPLGVTQGDMPAQSSDAGTAIWETIEISFLSEERVQIRNGANFETCNYAELGFEDGRTGKPNQAWETLRALAEKRGVIQDGTAMGRAWPMVEKQIQVIRKVLREHFGIFADPIPFVRRVGYKARFKVGCGPSFHT